MKYTCKTGYSTDGSNSEEAKDFSVLCTDAGQFTTFRVCEKIACDSYQLPVIANSVVMTDLENCFKYEDIVDYTCEPGYTLTGRDGGNTYFKVECQASGEFTEPEACLPVKCPDPNNEQPHATVSPSEHIQYPVAVTYRCDEGYETADGEIVLGMTCMADGKYDKMIGVQRIDVSGLVSEIVRLPECEPVKCGLPPVIQNDDGEKPCVPVSWATGPKSLASRAECIAARIAEAGQMAEHEPAARPSDGPDSELDTALAAQQQQSELGAPGAGELPTTLLESQRFSRVE